MDWNEKVPAVASCQDKMTAGKEENDSYKYQVAPLSQEHAKLVDNSWKFQNSLSLKMLEGLIEQKKLLGLFIDSSSEPIAWITIYR